MPSVTTTTDLGECQISIIYKRNNGFVTIESVELLSYPEDALEDICREDEAEELMCAAEARWEEKREERMLSCG